MALFFEVIDGPNQGSKFKIKSGLQVGRTQGEVLLRDNKVSSLHAKIETDSAGQLVLIDLDSSNGLRVDGLRMERVVIVPGVVIQVGRTFLKILQQDEESDPLLSIDPVRWRVAIPSLVSSIQGQDRFADAQALPFPGLVQLEFIEGAQSDTLWSLGFGPRKFGADVLDFEVHEEGCPPLAFEIHPDEEGPLFITSFPQIVKLNDRHQKAATLKSGDTIRIGKTLIRVTFTNRILNV